MAKTSKNTVNASEQELIETAEARGRKFGWLISQVFLNDEEKQAMLVLAEKMSSEQLDQLIGVLEQKYLQAQTKPVDDAYQASMRQAQSDYVKQQSRLNQGTLNKLKDLEQQINK